LLVELGPACGPFSLRRGVFACGRAKTIARIERKRNPGLTRRLANARRCTPRPPRTSRSLPFGRREAPTRSLPPGYALALLIRVCYRDAWRRSAIRSRSAC
jgi:hypothetical protein